MKKQLTFPQFRKFCLFFKSFPVKGTCTHKGNQTFEARWCDYVRIKGNIYQDLKLLEEIKK